MAGRQSTCFRGQTVQLVFSGILDTNRGWFPISPVIFVGRRPLQVASDSSAEIHREDWRKTTCRRSSDQAGQED